MYTLQVHNFRKKRIFELLKGDSNLAKSAEIYNDPNADKSSLYDVAKSIVFKLYGNYTYGSSMSLNEFRAECCTKIKKLELMSFPPTDGAITKHAERVYLQCQTWLGNNMDPCEFGWRVDSDILVPIYSDEPLVPDDLLKKFHCDCKKTAQIGAVVDNWV